MKRAHVLQRPISVSDIDMLELEDFDKDLAQQKAERVRLRKWRKVKHQSA